MRDPEIRTLVAQSCAAVRLSRPMSGIDIGMLAGEHLPKLFGRVSALGLAMAGAPYVRYHAWGGETAVLELGFPVAGDGDGRLPALESVPDGEPGLTALPGGPAVVAEHRGAYAALSDAWARVGAWIDEHGLVRGAAPWEAYVDNPDTVPQEQLRTEIVCPLTAGD